MPTIISLLDQYELLELTAKYISTLDLFHLALSNSSLYNMILKSKPIFDRLKSFAVCDGHGLKSRQEFSGIYELHPQHFLWGNGRKAHFDEELEVRVWNLKCDEENGLPCIRCGVNICEVRSSRLKFRVDKSQGLISVQHRNVGLSLVFKRWQICAPA